MSSSVFMYAMNFLPVKRLYHNKLIKKKKQVQIYPNFIEIYTVSKFILLLGQGISLNIHVKKKSNYSSPFSEFSLFRLCCPCRWGFLGVHPFQSSWVFPELTKHLRLRR